MKTFNYSSKSVWKDNISTIGLSVLMIVVPIVYPFGIRIGSTRVLGPLPTAVILVAIGLFILVRVLIGIRRDRALASKDCFITVDGDTVTYPAIKQGKVQQGTFRIPEITDAGYDNENDILTVTLANGDKTEFYLDYFDSPGSLKEFLALIQK